MSMKIFDLEQEFMNCWNAVDDINDLYEFVGDDPFFEGMDPKHTDKLMNLLLGLKEIYELRFNKTWNSFEEVCREYHKYRKFYEGNERESFDDDISLKGLLETTPYYVDATLPVDVSLTDYTLDPTKIPEGTVTVSVTDNVNFDTWSAWSGYGSDVNNTQISFDFGEVPSK